MAQTTNRPGAPGKYDLYREVASADTLPIPGGEKRGLQCLGFEKIHVQAKVPGTKPVITVLVWSTAADAFIPLVPAVSYTGPADSQSFEFTFDALGRMLFLSCSQACELRVSGVRDRTLI